MPGFSWSVLCHRLLYCLPFLVVSVKGACTWSAQSNTNVNAGDFNTGVTDLDGCKAACGDGCVAVTFSVDYFFPCKTFTTLPTDNQFEISSDYTCCTYYTKTCVDDEATTDTGATTDTTTVPITNAPDSGSCSMALKENKQVSSNPSKSLAVTDTSATCQKLCCCLSQCQAFSYDGRGGMCTLHTSTVTTTTTATGYKHGFKHGDNGCDFSVLENDKRVTSTSFFSINLQSQTDACKAMCVEINSCAALTVKPNTCVFNPDHSEPDQTDWYYYAKECTGSDPSTYTFATHCKQSTTAVPETTTTASTAQTTTEPETTTMEVTTTSITDQSTTAVTEATTTASTAQTTTEPATTTMEVTTTSITDTPQLSTESTPQVTEASTVSSTDQTSTDSTSTVTEADTMSSSDSSTEASSSAPSSAPETTTITSTTDKGKNKSSALSPGIDQTTLAVFVPIIIVLVGFTTVAAYFARKRYIASKRRLHPYKDGGQRDVQDRYHKSCSEKQQRETTHM